MSVQIVRFRTDPGEVHEVTQQIEHLFAAVREAAPPGMRYTALQEGDEPLFTLILELSDVADNPLPEIPQAVVFRRGVAAWAGGPVASRLCNVLGRYPA